MMPPTVLERGEGWVALHKPPGMSAHNDAGADLISWIRSSIPGDWRLVHRLDRETSGVVLACADSVLLAELQRQWSSFKKSYWLLARGQLSGEHHWAQPISDRSEGRRSPAGTRQHRVSAATNARSVYVGAHCSLVEAELCSGRQHQIRKHAVLNGHEVLLDKRYGQSKYVQRLSQRFPQSTLCLHAVSLALEIAGQRHLLCSPPPTSWDQFGIPVSELWGQQIR